MPRSRLLKPGFFKNEDLAELPSEGRLLFGGLWTIADREGKLNDRPRWIRSEIFPYENLDVDPLLQGLAAKNFIRRYSVDGERYIQIVNFLKHQKPHPRETPSEIPDPVEGMPEDCPGHAQG